ncbi:AraC-type DNA-binding protein [Bryocella elongata]|uniref:AraC-type DNA-binding protein n=1 Tax=Bryocella elongata TaxID=863522 RepID=A0A1H5WV49_9BACT|nr:AraC family transcriptional regulator [Bryocella elongata]SEG03324.1 AraC-type DNA-binding protein [Bryocella elongata]
MIHEPDFHAETPEALDDLRDPFALERDAMSDVLELIRVRGNTVFTCAAEAPFGIHFPAGKHRLHIIRSGSVVISVDGLDTVFQASQGDLVMLMHAHGHTISDQAGCEAVSLHDLASREYDRERLVLGRGDTNWLCGDFGFDGILAQRVLAVLPPVIVLKGLRDRPFEWLELSCHFILDEALHLRAGAAAMISRLLDVIFMQLLRTWASNGEVGRGWLSGAIDPRVNKAISAMHARPGHDWNVVELAKLSNLSRSAFADHFQRIVGQAPMAYLTAWRLDRSAELLRHGRAQVSEIARRVGYTSEAAFSRAFKSRFAMSPLHWRRTDCLLMEAQDRDAAVDL